MLKKSFLYIMLLSWSTTLTFAQGHPAVFQWSNLNTYNQVVDFTYYGQKFYCATESGFFIYDKENNYTETFSKSKGMNDVDIAALDFDAITKTLVIGYKNSNIDLWDGYQFRNVSDLRLANINGNKQIHHILTDKGKAYISTGLGLIVLDIKNRKIDKTVRFYEDQAIVEVVQSYIANGKVFVATANGVYVNDLEDSFFENGQHWTHLYSAPSPKLSGYHDLVFFSAGYEIYKVNPSFSLSLLFTSDFPIDLLNAYSEGLWISGVHTEEDRRTLKLDHEANLVDSLQTRAPSKIITLSDGSTWYGDYSDYRHPGIYGFHRSTGWNSTHNLTPPGPGVQDAFDVDALNGNIYIAHGAYEAENYRRSHNRKNFSTYTNHSWHHYHWVSDEDYIEDFVRILAHPHSEQFYVGSYACGLMKYNSKFDHELLDGTKLPAYSDSSPESKVGGMTWDKDLNLWVTTNFSSNELTVIKPDGTILPMRSILNNNVGAIPHSAADIVIDNQNNKWFITTSNNGGVIIYDDGGTLDNTSDDRYKILRAGEGNGGLPSANTRSIAKDHTGAIWIGTDNGIGIIYCPERVLEGNCEASKKYVTNEEDGFTSGNLFENQMVNAIAVDGGNRKWIGTPAGAWLLSSDGEKELLHFNKENSPLPDNYIRRIKIDPSNGDVYFVTANGIAVFKGDAIQAQENLNNDLHIYPNPVPNNFQGQIVIDNLTDQADVRITDINSNLVYKTKSNGGRAIWDGYDYTGAKAQSGVYIVYVISARGEMTQTGKFVIHR